MKESGPIVLWIWVHGEERKYFSLEEVEGNNKRPKKGSPSEVEWAKEVFAMKGGKFFFEGTSIPRPSTGLYRLEGKFLYHLVTQFIPTYVERIP